MSSGSIYDRSSNESTRTITIGHSRIHEGKSFFCEELKVLGSVNDTLALCFKTPPDSSERVNLVISSFMLAQGVVELIEGPTWDSSSGTQKTIYNRLRESSNTSGVLEDTTGSFAANSAMVLDPTNLTGGTAIMPVGTISGQTLWPGDPDRQEIVLNPDTTYCVRATALAGSNSAQMFLTWYEG